MPAKKAKKANKRKKPPRKAKQKPKKSSAKKAGGTSARKKDGKAHRKPRGKHARPRRRGLRVKPIDGPFQLPLPLQMPLALGAEAFFERPAPDVVATDDDDDRTATDAPGGEQRGLFD